ncbi:MAG: glutamate mutase L [Bacteroidota bacterium]
MTTGSQGLTLIAEIGSTTTIVNAFTGLDGPQPSLVGQGQALTTVDQGDVRIGLAEARAALERQVGPIGGAEVLATSSAAGGLSVTVHGLVYDMTVRAAREAALGAGAVVRLVTAGLLEEEDLGQIEAIAPRLIVLAGGLDYGEERTVLENARRLARLGCRAPVVYAGNVALQRRVAALFASAGREVHLLPNVYPSIDQLVVDPARAVLHRVFEEQITRAPGMDHVKEMVGGRIMPTPGAVMLAAAALYEEIGDLVVVDVGGATTDVHSVTEGSASLRHCSVEPEPLAKRTVEGDLGVFRNAPQIAAMLDLDTLPPALPETGKEVKLALKYTETAVREAVMRHVGRLRHIFTPTGRVEVIVGRDLTAVGWVIGTGGALTRLSDGAAILAGVRRRRGEQLLLPEHPKVALDRDYVMSACGAMLERWPKAAMALLRKSLGV